MTYRSRTAISRNRWNPANLGPTAWWTADPRFITVGGGALDADDVGRWRNCMDGRSGVWSATDPEQAPFWESNWRGAGPALRFESQDVTYMFEETSETAGLASVITAQNGTDLPFTVVMTIQKQRAVPLTDYAIQLLLWSDLGGLSVIRCEIESNDVLQFTRTDEGGTTTDAAGSIEVGTSVRRIAFVFEGTVIKTYIDTQLDLNTASNVGPMNFDRLRLGDSSGADGPRMYLSDLAVIPRAINYAEWLHYYEWSVRKWGPIKAPTYVGSGAGADLVTSGALEVPVPTTQTGDLLMLVVGSRSETVPPATEPAGWSLYEDDTNPNATGRIYFRQTRAVGNEAGFIVYDTGTANMWCAQIHVFRGVSQSATTDGYLESTATTEVDGPGSLTGPTLSPNGYGRLAVAAVFVDVETVVTAFAGSTGGTWSQAAQFNTNVGANFTLQLQTAMLGPAPISGGTLSIAGSDAAICRALALVGE